MSVGNCQECDACMHIRCLMVRQYCDVSASYAHGGCVDHASGSNRGGWTTCKRWVITDVTFRTCTYASHGLSLTGYGSVDRLQCVRDKDSSTESSIRVRLPQASVPAVFIRFIHSLCTMSEVGTVVSDGNELIADQRRLDLAVKCILR
jgi:hypothetical protein